MQQKIDTLRSPQTEELYQKLKEERIKLGCALCRLEAIETYTYWKIIPNEFPYDSIAKRHDMLVPLRHTAELNEEERKEYHVIRNSYVEDNYRYIMEAVNRRKSIPDHYHLHLIELK